MKDKLIALLKYSCDAETKAELLEEFIRMCCEEYIVFNTERDEWIVSLMGLDGFMEDASTITKQDIFERFKDYLIDKYQKQIGSK